MLKSSKHSIIQSLAKWAIVILSTLRLRRPFDGFLRQHRWLNGAIEKAAETDSVSAGPLAHIFRRLDEAASLHTSLARTAANSVF